MTMNASDEHYTDAGVRELTHDIGMWGDSTFPRDDRAAAVWGAANHLDDEVGELKHALTEPFGTWAGVKEELADVFILAFQLAHLLDIDVASAISDKMAVNRKRDWGEVDHRGVAKHVETGASHGMGRDTCTDDDSSPPAQPP